MTSNLIAQAGTHEAAHTLTAWLLRFRAVRASVNRSGDGWSEFIPDFSLRPIYRRPDMFAIAFVGICPFEDNADGAYLGPLPAVLPPGGIRVVAELMAILGAGYASHEATSDWYERDADESGTDARRIAVLISAFPECALVWDRLLPWLPEFMNIARPELTIIADALIDKLGDDDSGELIGADLTKTYAALNEKRLAELSRVLSTRLDALTILAEYKFAA